MHATDGMQLDRRDQQVGVRHCEEGRPTGSLVRLCISQERSCMRDWDRLGGFLQNDEPSEDYNMLSSYVTSFLQFESPYSTSKSSSLVTTYIILAGTMVDR